MKLSAAMRALLAPAGIMALAMTVSGCQCSKDKDKNSSAPTPPNTGTPTATATGTETGTNTDTEGDKSAAQLFQDCLKLPEAELARLIPQPYANEEEAKAAATAFCTKLAATGYDGTGNIDPKKLSVEIQ